jgi:CubicO group peptidase (beta-lactamase class C family)
MQDEGYKEITVAQLLTHRSGIPDSGDAMADWETLMPEYDAGAAERWVRTALAEKGLLFAPGSNFEYSDLGYALLGPVIAAASGQTYEDYVSEHIFAPLDMSHSTFLLEEVDRTLLAMPHGPDATGDGMVSVALPYHRPFAATNNLFTSIEEMAKLAQAYLNHGELNDQRILPESVIAQMWQPQSPTPYADFAFGQLYPSPMMIDWGYGWFLGDIDGYVSPNAFGREFGFHAGTVLVPEAGLAVIAIGNGAVTNEYYAHDTATDVMAIVLEEIKSK